MSYLLRRLAGSLFCLALLLSGCKMPAPNQGISAPKLPTLTPIATDNPISSPTNLATAAPTLPLEAAGVLPRPLLYLAPDVNGISQLWQLETDAQTLHQLSQAAQSLRAYDVLRAGPHAGWLSYISNEQLWLAPPDGGNPTPIFQGSPGSPLLSPRWSPDGSLLAFAGGGIQLYSPTDGIIRLALPNPPGGLLSPVDWSPDGRWLLLRQSSVNANESLLAWQIAAGAPITPPAALCCQAAWSPDSNSVLIANPDPGQGEAGLWRYSPVENHLQILIPAIATDGTYNVAGWPALTNQGRLVYAFANFPQPPVGDFPLTLFAAQTAHPEARFPLRTEALLLRQVLWAPNAELAVLVLPQPGAAGALDAGPIILVHSDGRPAQPLAGLGYALQWGR